jgi:hypothetical protein
MALAYAGMFGTSPVKPDIRVIAWKEGGRLREALRDHSIDPPALAGRLGRLRFLSPIRHPIDHALSLRHFYANGVPPWVSRKSA